jgi:hypothetical protein
MTRLGNTCGLNIGKPKDRHELNRKDVVFWDIRGAIGIGMGNAGRLFIEAPGPREARRNPVLG